MTEGARPQVGKIGSSIFRDVIYPRLGAPDERVLVGPRYGIDVGVLDIGGGQVMAVTTDPFFVVPEYGWERAGWFAVQIVASDAATSGLHPAYMSVDLNLPPDLPDADVTELWEAVHCACEEIGMAIVAGHTGRYDGCAFPMLGGATVMSVGPRERYITPAMASPGDAILLTKGPAIETAALFAVTYPDRIADALGAKIAQAGATLFWSMSVVRDARIAAEVGVRDRGVTGMHDATEGGVLGAAAEMGEAASAGLLIDPAAVPVRQEVAAICRLFEVDPWASSSEGTLLLTCGPRQAGAVIRHLGDAGIDAFRLGEMTAPSSGMRVVREGREVPLDLAPRDPFWPAYAGAREGGT